ncbi:dsRBD fold-containing protein [Amycolatopsis benzoatilytica]|uniref:dsRBD fold-containing protein n=1 Tax=Amycolatopsis benzoatilytica TaxID=346045 RepID=UPI000378EA81|nr:dsRBD fold-containing protein [Amycolatopsis benzoatilytica]
MHTGHWQVDVFLTEEDGRTHAIARLHTGTGELSGDGTARRNPADANVPEIGDELAAARALSALAHRLLETVVDDIEGVTHKSVRLRR